MEKAERNRGYLLEVCDVHQSCSLSFLTAADSTVLAHLMTLLNERYDYGLDLFLLSVDEGIRGYRDDSLETVQRNKNQYQVPLQVVSYHDLYGWTMDSIVAEIGLKNNCTVCGVFRRQALDRGAMLLKADKLVTGHNADDVAETVLMNVMRGDIARLARCVSITTGEEGSLPRCKPFKYTYEKEIVLYAYHKKLDYFSTECMYAPQAYRGFAREYLKDLEAVRSSSILDILRAAEELVPHIRVAQDGNDDSAGTPGSSAPVQQTRGVCERCGYMTSQRLCKACVLLDGLNRGEPRRGLGKGLPGQQPCGACECGSAAPSHATGRPKREGSHGPVEDGQSFLSVFTGHSVGSFWPPEPGPSLHRVMPPPGAAVDPRDARQVFADGF